MKIRYQTSVNFSSEPPDEECSELEYWLRENICRPRIEDTIQQLAETVIVLAEEVMKTNPALIEHVAAKIASHRELNHVLELDDAR